MSRALSLFYRSLGQTLGTGLPLAKALELSPAPKNVRDHLVGKLMTGSDWGDALADAPPWLPIYHRAILTAAAASGRLPETLAELSAEAERAHSRKMQAIGASAYPFFLVHFAVLVVPIVELVNGSALVYARQVGGILVPVWAVLLGIVLWVKRAPASAFSTGMFFPGLRGWLRDGQISRLATLLEAQLSAGVEMPRAWHEGARSLRWKALRDLSTHIGDAARMGEPPSALFRRGGPLPDTFIQLYTSGEISGKLEDNLKSLARMYDDSSQRSLGHAAFWYPKILYIACAVWIATKIISFYAGYFGQINEMLGP
jgi:type II secretory pathway component PulF